MRAGLRITRAPEERRKELETVIKACGSFVRDYFDMRNTKDYWAQGLVWAVECAGEYVAFAVVVPLKTQPVLSLYNIGVLPQWRGAGIATLLMQHIWRQHPDHPIIRLVSSRGNTEAFRLYAAWGLQHQGVKTTRRNGDVDMWEGRPAWSSR